MGRKRIKQYLMLLLVIGVIAVVASGNGTFASFTAQTTNANNVFATGTLYLHNSGTDNSGNVTTCESEVGVAGYNDNEACNALFTLNPLTSTSGAQVAYLTLANAGTLDSANIAFSGSCTPGTTQGSTVFGSVSLCDGLTIMIQELAPSGGSSATVVGCAYGTDTTNASTCGGGVALSTAFGSSHDLNLQSGENSNTGTALSGGNSRYFKITVTPPAGASFDNTYMNRKATFSLGWQLSA